MPPINTLIKGYVAFLVLLLGVTPACFAGLFDDEEARLAIIDLRQKVEVIDQSRLQDKQNLQELLKHNYSLRDENMQAKRSLLELQVLIDNLRIELSKQLGRQEQITKEISDLQQRQRDFSVGLEDRLRRIEPSKVTQDGLEFVAEPAEIKEFEVALNLVRKNEFKLSVQSFIEFLRRYPQSGYKSSVLFWLGSAQYASREYREAITSFKASIEAGPTSSKTPEAYLAIAASQVDLKDTRAARRTLTDLIKLHPNSEAAEVGKDRLTRLK